ncbi:MAG: hypothetical protein RR209_02050, partial [Angelakisella sp.]
VELKQLVADAIKKLPPKQQYVIREHYFNDKLFTEIVDGIRFKNQFEVARVENSAMCTLRRNKELKALYYAYFGKAPPKRQTEITNPEAAACASETWDNWISNLTEEIRGYSGEFSENAGSSN